MRFQRYPRTESAFPRYHPPYPVLYAEVPSPMSYIMPSNNTGMYSGPMAPYTGRRSQRLYNARLVNSQYLYEDPYTTIAEDVPSIVMGSFAKEDRIARREARRARRAERRSARQERRSARKSARAERKAQRRANKTGAKVAMTAVAVGTSLLAKPSVEKGMDSAQYILTNKAALLASPPPRYSTKFVDQARAESAAFKDIVNRGMGPQGAQLISRENELAQADKENNTLLWASVGLGLSALIGVGGYFYMKSQRDEVIAQQQGSTNYYQYY